MAIIVAAAAFCIYYIADYHLEQKRVDKVNIEIATDVVIVDAHDKAKGKKKQIDISKMMEKYPNACGYIYSEDFISYPVLQCDNNDFYLKHDVYGNYSEYGSIYFDFRCTSSSRKYIMYGHNMNNGSMFGNLDKLKDSQFLEKHKDFLVAIRNNTYECEIVYTAYTTAGSNWYELEYQEKDDIENFVNNMENSAYNKTGAKIGENDGLLLLSTCTTGNGRYVVLLKIKDLIIDDNEETLYRK